MGNCISGGARYVRLNEQPLVQEGNAQPSGRVRLPERVGSPGFAHALTRPATGPGQAQWDKIERKLEPYISKSNPGFEKLNLNCMVSVLLEHEDPTRSKGTVQCRHFATAFARHAGKKQELVKTFGAQESIREHFYGKLQQMEHDYRWAFRSTPAESRHLLVDTQLGHYLSALARALPAPTENEVSESNSLLITINHAMALHVQRKCKEGVDYFSAILYYPNVTATYKRVEARTAEAFENISLEELMVFPADRSAYGISPDGGLRMMAICLEKSLPLDAGRRMPDPTGENMFLAIRYGSSYDIEAIGRALDVEKNSLSSDMIFKILRACQLEGGPPAICWAMQEGDASSLRAFADAVLKAQLSNDQNFELLSAMDARSIPGISMAMGKGHAAVVRAFGDAVLKFKFTDEQQFKLFSAMDARSVLGVRMAMQNGHADVVRAFVSMVLESGLSDDQKFKLLAARTASGYPSLVVAMQLGHADVVRAFVSMVLESGLSDDQKFELVAAMDANGRTGLRAAKKNGHPQVLEAWMEVLLESDLPADKKQELLKLAGLGSRTLIREGRF